MAHFWLGLDQPSIGEAVLLVRRTFRLTRAQLIDRLSRASEGTDLGPDESVVFRWEKGKMGRDRPKPNDRRRALLAKVCEEEIRTLDIPSRREFLSALTVIGGVPWFADLLDGLLQATATAERLGERPDAKRTSSLGTANRRAAAAVHVGAVRDLCQTLRRLDNQFGGGYAYSMTTRHLEDVVIPLLRDASYTEDTGRQLYGATAELAHLAGWMAYDIARHGQARSYLDQALRLAMTARDDAFSAEILAGMSHQAVHLDQPNEAIDLARAAQAVAGNSAPPSLVAEAHVMEAHGYARLGDPRLCGISLHRAEATFRPSHLDDRPEWLRYFDEAYMAAKFAHCFRDLGDWRQAERFARRALDMNNRFVRGRTFNTVLLATALVHDDLEQACSVGLEAVTLAIHLQSGRTIQYIRDLQRRLHQRGKSTRLVREFDDRLTELLGAAAPTMGTRG
jgi:tetratricopeptide (TPR) repeat protein